MDIEAQFLEAIRAEPNDVTCRLVYADWLEQRGDPRAQEIRTRCQYRLPITAKETRHLSMIAAARRGAIESQVKVDIDLDNLGYRFSNEPTLNNAPTGADLLADDLHNLSLVEIARNFPLEDNGNLQLGRKVLLSEYRCADELPRGREWWLVAAGPQRRSDPQLLTVRLDLVISENEPNNWSNIRWWWDKRSTPLDEDARWGISGNALRQITGPGHEQERARLEAVWREEKLTVPERILLCTALQDDGRFEDALRVCNCEFPPELSRMLNAELFALEGGCCEPANEKSATARAKKLRRALWEAAPWRFSEALADAQARLDIWRRAKPGRPRKVPQLRFFILPGSSHHARKPGLMLVPGTGGQPKLSFVFTASNVVLPETSWRRPVELDIARWSLILRARESIR